jgi:hypothetical protein
MRELLFLFSVCIIKIPSVCSVPRTFEVAKHMQRFEQTSDSSRCHPHQRSRNVFTPNTIESDLTQLTLLGQLSLSLSAIRSKIYPWEIRRRSHCLAEPHLPRFFLGFETGLRIFPARVQITLFGWTFSAFYLHECVPFRKQIPPPSQSWSKYPPESFRRYFCAPFVLRCECDTFSIGLGRSHKQGLTQSMKRRTSDFLSVANQPRLQ